jgi:hypothetical protein
MSPAAAKAARMPGSIYSLHPAFKMEENAIRNLEARTGRTLEEWIALIKRTGPSTEKERRTWLQSAHALGRGYAWWLAAAVDAKGWSSAANYNPEAHVEALFAGSKAALRPLYETLLKLGFALGKDVMACPCKTFVPLYREHVFAQIKPTTRTRIDFGLALADTPFTARLLDTGGRARKDRITHRIAIETADDIDAEVTRWLKKAYQLDAPA